MHGELSKHFIRKNLSRKRAGFTLTEVVVASSLLVVAMIPILRALTAAHLNSALIERRTQCLAIAQTKLDEVKARMISDFDSSYSELDTSLAPYLCRVVETIVNSDLKRVHVRAGFDLNGDNNLPADEDLIVLLTMIARRQ